MTFVALVAARWVQFLAAMIPLGTSLFPLYALPSKTAADRAHVTPTLRNALAVAALAAAVAFSFGTTATASGWADCRGADLDLDRRIAGCSEVIAGIARRIPPPQDHLLHQSRHRLSGQRRLRSCDRRFHQGAGVRSQIGARSLQPRRGSRRQGRVRSRARRLRSGDPGAAEKRAPLLWPGWRLPIKGRTRPRHWRL